MKRLLFGTSLVLNIILLGMVIVYPTINIAHTSKSDASPTSRESLGTYPFLANRLFAENKNDVFVNFMPLREAIREYIGKQQERISLYFEYLPSGSSIGVNDTTEYQMASLAKVPTIMAIYDKIRKGALSKEQVLTLEARHINKKYGTFWEKAVGTKITLKEAVEKTLIESDNTTHEMLYDLLTADDKARILQQLDIRIELDGKELNSFVSAKSYASILKSLYLASYLTQDDSNEILAVLSKSAFGGGIVAGIDSEVLVAHKTGTLERPDDTDIENDCGIVYVPKRPYILCVLASGEDAKKIDAHMTMLSRIIYTYLVQVNR